MNLFISIFGKFFKEMSLYDDNAQRKICQLIFSQTHFINLYKNK